MRYDELLKHDLLRKSEEYQLLKKAQAGDEDARDRLITLNLRLVHKIAQGYARPDIGASAIDLLGDGVRGLIHAIDNFDVERDLRFSTYAYLTIHFTVAVQLYFDL